MQVIASTLDDLLYSVLTELVKLPFDVQPTKGKNSEVLGALLILENPRARLSVSESRGKAFSPLGEFLWYLSKSNKLDFIEYYIPNYKKSSDDGKTIFGGYGPRLFKMHGEINQVENIITLLRENPNSRRAVIQLFDAKDLLEGHKDIPCTCFLQFLVRGNALHLYASMRSNDAYLGLPHDIFCFTMLQEIVACELNYELGTYYHAVGSLHLYERNKKAAENYLNEGVQGRKFVMNSMPSENVWDNITKLLEVERQVRSEGNSDIHGFGLDSYWSDLAHLIKIHSSFVEENVKDVEDILTHIESDVPKHFVRERLKKLSSK